MLDLLIQNGHVVNAENSQDVDIAIKDGKIVAIGEAAQMAEAEKTIDAKGLWVLPGMIDAHAHRTGADVQHGDGLPPARFIAHDPFPASLKKNSISSITHFFPIVKKVPGDFTRP